MTRTTIAVLLMLALGAGVAAAQGSGRAPAAAKETIETPVNLNTASASQLETLPGVGPATAQRILEYRQKSGGFKKIEDLREARARVLAERLNDLDVAADGRGSVVATHQLVAQALQ